MADAAIDDILSQYSDPLERQIMETRLRSSGYGPAPSAPEPDPRFTGVRGGVNAALSVVDRILGGVPSSVAGLMTGSWMPGREPIKPMMDEHFKNAGNYVPREALSWLEVPNPSSVLNTLAAGAGAVAGKVAHALPDAVPTVAAAAAVPAMRAQQAAAQARALDPLGYYSHAYEVARTLPQPKGTPEQMLAMLRKAGVKDAEIAATNLNRILEGKDAVTRDDIVKHLEGNKLALNESTYWGGKRNQGNLGMREYENMTPDELLAAFEAPPTSPPTVGPQGPARWNDYSLDPKNPTYRETVLHLPEDTTPRYRPVEHPTRPGEWALIDDAGNYKMSVSQYHPDTPSFYSSEQFARNAAASDREHAELNPSMSRNFRSGHFSEPNIVGHMMTSMVKDKEGKPVFLVDQIQSDWGQKLRDGGVRDEAKIAELKKRFEEADAAEKNLLREVQAKAPEGDRIKSYDGDARDRLSQLSATGDPIGQKWRELWQQRQLLGSELRTAEASAPGHPLVNTTDQWVNTTLRRAIQQAIASGADHIAIPSGKTVLSYNPGDEHGMAEFYGKIVPKNLRNILSKYDKSVSPQFVDQLDTPSKGPAGDGFTVFPLTDPIRKAVKEGGLPLFAQGGGVDGILAQYGRR